MDIFTAVFMIIVVLLLSCFVCYRIHKNIDKKDDGFPETRDRR